MVRNKQITRVQEIIYELKVDEGMTKDVIVANSTMYMSDLGNIFLSKSISGVPVVDNGDVIGFVSIWDYIKWLAKNDGDCMISKTMTRKVKTVFTYSPFAEVLKKFDRYKCTCFPVIDDNLKLVGVLTKGDIIRSILKKLEVEYLDEDIHTYRASHIFEDIIAEKTTLKFQYSIKGKEFKRAGECATNLKKTLKRLGFQVQVIRRVAIAVYEAEMNMIVFCDSGEILAEVEQDRITILATDCGPGIEDIEQAMVPGYSTAPDWVRELGFGAGMGLYNIKKCSDDFKILSTIGKGTELRIDIFLSPDKE